MSVKSQRPLSPHLQVYKPQISSVLSILHRITGVYLSLGSLVLATWVFAAANDAALFEQLNHLLGGIIGQLLLVSWSAAFYYHLFNGIRHLNWDMGKGLEVHEMTRSGILTLVATAILTIATWFFVWGIV